MTTDRNLGRPAPNEDKDQNIEQLKTRRKGTIGSRAEAKKANASGTGRERRDADRRADETSTRRPAPGM